MDEDKEITANFIGKEFNVSVDVVGEGNIEGEGIYRTGDTVELEAIPKDDWEFVEWKGYFEIEGETDKKVEFEIPGKDLELLAEFEEDIKPAYFEVDIEAEPEIVTWGDKVTITVEVQNTGGVEDTQIIKFYVYHKDDEDELILLIETREITLEPGESREEMKVMEVPDNIPTGDYIGRVESEDDEDEITIELKELVEILTPTRDVEISNHDHLPPDEEVHWTEYWGENEDKSNVYLLFDFEELPEDIEIISAELKLFAADSEIADGFIGVFRDLEEWDENTDWDDRPEITDDPVDKNEFDG